VSRLSGVFGQQALILEFGPARSAYELHLAGVRGQVLFELRRRAAALVTHGTVVGIFALVELGVKLKVPLCAIRHATQATAESLPPILIDNLKAKKKKTLRFCFQFVVWFWMR